MEFTLTILGSNSAIPAYGRLTTSQAVTIGSDIFLIDTGEAVQIQLSKYRIKRNKIKAIFISHLHGDHILGLPGLLTSLSLNNRSLPLTIYGPDGLEEFINCFLKVSKSVITYPISFVEVNSSEKIEIYQNETCVVSAFPVKHRIPCWGYLFEEKSRPLNIKQEAIEKYKLNIEEIISAKQGLEILRYGEILSSDLLCHPREQTRSYAFCADTVYTESFINDIKHVGLMYHEATYLHDLQEKAISRGHSTALEAGMCAKKVGAEKLIIGHYSSRYKNLEPLLKEARSIFPNTDLAIEGSIHHVGTGKNHNSVQG